MKEDLLARLVGLAERNNQNKNFPLTIVKVADYLEDCETVNRERIYLVFNQYVLPEFKEVMFDFVSQIIQREFKGRAQISVGENFVEFWGVGD